MHPGNTGYAGHTELFQVVYLKFSATVHSGMVAGTEVGATPGTTQHHGAEVVEDPHLPTLGHPGMVGINMFTVEEQV